MIISKKAIPRRRFLRGTGAALALPLLDAMVPAMTPLMASPGAPVRRLGYVYVPMGSIIAEWTPSTVGKIDKLSPTLRRHTSRCSSHYFRTGWW